MHQIAYTARLDFAFAVKSPLVAQLDRAPGFEPGCREFESLRAGHLFQENPMESVAYLYISLAAVYITVHLTGYITVYISKWICHDDSEIRPI